MQQVLKNLRRTAAIQAVYAKQMPLTRLTSTRLSCARDQSTSIATWADTNLAAFRWKQAENSICSATEAQLDSKARIQALSVRCSYVSPCSLVVFYPAAQS